MASFLLYFSIFSILLHSQFLFTEANLYKTNNLFKNVVLPETLYTTTSPTVFFEVTKPIKTPKSQSRCSHSVLSHDFGYTYAKPPVVSDYTPPSHCPFQEFSKIVLEWRATCKGRQFDRIFGVWLNGIELLRSCTAEPTATGIEWTVEKDVTRYYSLLVKNETQTLAVYLGNLIDETYTGVYHVEIIFHFYPAEEGLINLPNSLSGYGSYADLILPISRNPPLNDGLWLEILNSADTKSKEFVIPKNVYRAVLEVYVSFHENDEFWYGNLPNDYIEANNLNAPGNGPFREVVVSLDGDAVGAIWPFPVVYTGGINPLLWRPVTAIGSFDLPSYDIEITPFLGNLLDGKSHKFDFKVTNALNVWFIDANLHLWLDHKNEEVKGKLLKVRNTPFVLFSVSDFSGLNGKFLSEANRSVSSTGWVKSSHGMITTQVIQEFSYSNTMVMAKEGDLQIIDQLIQVEDHVNAKRFSSPVHSVKFSSKSFPFYLYSDNVEQGDDTYLSIANVSMSFNEKKCEDVGSRSFVSDLKNKQDGQGLMVVKGNLVTRGLGNTQVVYEYDGTDLCYSRNISSSNYTVLYDNVSTLCKKLPSFGPHSI